VSDVVDVGLDLTSDSAYPFDVDIEHRPRGTLWDVGAFEL
jgi:hypothetical protein